jgi:hypothetical protein
MCNGRLHLIGNAINALSIIVALNIHKNEKYRLSCRLEEKTYYNLQHAVSYMRRMKDNSMGDGDIQATLALVAAT